jgi:hypothetical protein
MKRHATSGVLATLVLGLGLATAARAADEASGSVTMPPGEIPQVLAARAGKPVTLLLRSGKEYGGTVGEVRGQSVVLKGIAGKEFYDALVRLDDISAVEVRNR